MISRDRYSFDDSSCSFLRWFASRHLEVGDGRWLGDRTDKALQIGSQFLRSTPLSGYDNLAIGVDDEFGVWSITQGMFQAVVHVVTNPRNLGTEGPFCFVNMHQPFLDIERCDVSVVFGMSECLVDVIELHTLGLIVALDCLQTGDISKKRWSGQAAKHQHCVTAPQACGREITTLLINRPHGG